MYVTTCRSSVQQQKQPPSVNSWCGPALGLGPRRSAPERAKLREIFLVVGLTPSTPLFYRQCG
jgi:hypothetical protein